jgi:hypothetical protein
MNRRLFVWLNICLLFFVKVIAQNDTITKILVKKNAFGFNLDWHLGYNYLRSGAPLEFLGLSPSPDLLGGSFDYIYKGDWQINLSWKTKATFIRHTARFNPGENNKGANENFFMYEVQKAIIPSLLYSSNGILVSKRILSKGKWTHFVGLGFSLNRFKIFDRYAYYVKYDFKTYQAGNTVYAENFYSAEVEYKQNIDLRKNEFFPKYFNSIERSSLFYLVSYKMAYTAYYPIFKGRMQLLFGCGFEYSPRPIAHGTYTLFSKVDKVNTSGSFNRYMSNAFVKVGFRFGRMGVRLINIK